MAEIIDLLEYKRKKEQAELESMKAQLENIVTVFPPDVGPYYLDDGPYYTYDSSYCYPSLESLKGSCGDRGPDERDYLFSDLWHNYEEPYHNEWE